MLSAYARRGSGLTTLKNILEEPLQKLCALKDLNLEINPSKIYLSLIQDYETNTGKVSDLPKDIGDAEAAAHPEVEAIVQDRVDKLLHWVDIFLNRIIEGVQTIPYGMRWICKQLSYLCALKFPSVDKYQLSSLMGGYIYLRFFNPVIVAPDAINFIKDKPSRNMRRNLVLVSQSIPTPCIVCPLSNSCFS